MSAASAITVAVTFVWLGMVLAISFLEAPLKFRAPHVVASSVAIAALALQLTAVRPSLTRRSEQVLAGLDAPRSRAHHVYIGLEVVKVIALVAAGALLLIA